MKENAALKRALTKTYPAFLKALQSLKPKAKELIEDEVFSRAHDIFALVLTGYLHVEWLDGFDERYLALSVKEKK